MPRRVLILVNQTKPQAIAALEGISDVIKTHSTLIDVVDAINPEHLPSPSGVDLVVALGGDGTILKAADHCLAMGCPLLGVNIGKVGFMAGYEIDTFQRDAHHLLDQCKELPLRLAHPLQAQLVRTDGSNQPSMIALNEFVITAGPPYRIIEIDISIDNNPGPTVAGDGVMVSTPLGSTAYNVSAGGPIVAPGVNANIITPIAAHSLSFRPIVVPNDSAIRLTARRVNAEDSQGTCILVDGQPGPQLHEGDQILITKHAQPVSFVVDPGVSYWSTLIQKMHWALAPNGHGINPPTK